MKRRRAIKRGRCFVAQAAAIAVAALVFCGPLVVRGHAPARPPYSTSAQAESLISNFEVSYRDVRALRAAFVQEYTAWDRTRTESGTVYLERGGKMRWEYVKPEEKLFLCDGKYVSLYVPSEKQLTRTPVKSSGDLRVPFEILVSHANLRRAFSRVELAESPPIERGDPVLRAFPKQGEEDVYRDVLVELTPQFDIRHLAVEYTDGTRMEFTFEHVARNPALAPSLFTLTPPEGTEVINQ